MVKARLKLRAIEDALVAVPRYRILAAVASLAQKSLYNPLESPRESLADIEAPEGAPQKCRQNLDSSPTSKKTRVSHNESNPVNFTTRLVIKSCLERNALKQMSCHHCKQNIPIVCYNGNTPSWQKNEAKFSDHYKQDITTRVSTTCYGSSSSTHSRPMEEDITVLYNQEIMSMTCFSDSAPNHPKVEGKETDNNESAGFLSPNATPLLFFYDCESTGGNVHDDHIIEIAAEVIGPSKPFVTGKSFSELCYTPYSILGIGCGVTEDMLVGKREFSDVFPDFLSWVNKCIKEAKKATGKPFYPVLVAHNGFVFDFRILAAEVERRNLVLQFNRADLGFADTLYELQKMRKARDPILSDWSPQERRRLSMNNLHRKYFPRQNHFSSHRALEDVQMMIKIFTTSQLSKVLQSLTMRSTSEIISDWKKKHKAYTISNM